MLEDSLLSSTESISVQVPPIPQQLNRLRQQKAREPQLGDSGLPSISSAEQLGDMELRPLEGGSDCSTPDSHAATGRAHLLLGQIDSSAEAALATPPAGSSARLGSLPAASSGYPNGYPNGASNGGANGYMASSHHWHPPPPLKAGEKPPVRWAETLPTTADVAVDAASPFHPAASAVSVDDDDDNSEGYYSHPFVSAPAQLEPELAAAAARDPELASLLHKSPFLDTNSPMTGWEWFKLVVMLPLFLLRCLVTLVIITIVWAVTRLVISGHPLNVPLPRWRLCILRPWLMFWAAVLLRAGLNFWPTLKGGHNIPKARDAKALLVFNHVSYVDAIIMASIFAPCGVAKAAVADIPFFGVFTRALQFLFIARRGTQDAVNKYVTAGNTTQKIAQRLADGRYPFFMIAPEATTKQRHCLLKFSTGAFVAGAPVCPVLLRYRARYFNCGWGICNTMFHLLRMSCQFVNHLEIEVLEPYLPSEEERASPALYAENVRRLMGRALGCELSRHGIPEHQELKRRGIYVDWTGRTVRCRPVPASKQRDPAATPAARVDHVASAGLAP